MRIYTPTEAAKQAGNKYLGVLVAAKFARHLNDLPKERIADRKTEADHPVAREAGGWRPDVQAHSPSPLGGVVHVGRPARRPRRVGRDRQLQELHPRPAACRAGRAGGRHPHGGAAEFVRPVTFEALTGRPVLTSLWQRGAALEHVRLAQEADLIVVAPATAHLLARAAQGLARRSPHRAAPRRAPVPVLLAPAMNDAMFAHPATQANLQLLAGRGCAMVGPEVGAAGRGASDRPGRMSEPETILAHAARLLRRGGPLAGRRCWSPRARPASPSIRSASSPTVPAARWASGSRRPPGSAAPR